MQNEWVRGQKIWHSRQSWTVAGAVMRGKGEKQGRKRLRSPRQDKGRSALWLSYLLILACRFRHFHFDAEQDAEISQDILHYLRTQQIQSAAMDGRGRALPVSSLQVLKLDNVTAPGRMQSDVTGNALAKDNRWKAPAKAGSYSVIVFSISSLPMLLFFVLFWLVLSSPLQAPP